GGGGIDSWGTLTLANTTISNNRVGSASGLSTLASDAQGGAMISRLDALTIKNSVISDNAASATAPNGRFAEGGGIFAPGGTLTISDSAVTGNSALLEASLPNTVELLAQSGGIFIAENRATITATTISGNSAAMTNTAGDATAFSGGVNVGSEVEFRMSNNHLHASSPTGSVSVIGAGVIVAEHTLTLRNTTVSGNTGDASGPSGFARGGGIYDGPFFDIAGSPLVLMNSSVTGNVLTGS